VRYEIGGRQLTGYWFYVHRTWVFDLVLSNPDAAMRYRMSPAGAPPLSAAHTEPACRQRDLPRRRPGRHR
jgi:hypothetical protein